MLLDKIIGHKKVVEQLKKSVENQKISHAQMFVGPEGSGILESAIAYAELILEANKDENSGVDINSFSHPDLHFVFPVYGSSQVKPVSKDFYSEWTEFRKENEYPNLNDWQKKLGFEKKALSIYTSEAAEIVRSMSLKSYEGGFKVMIIWMAEYMSEKVANKLLKIIEEPDGKSVFILVTEDENKIISTIKSRTQKIYFNRLSDEEVKNYLVNKHNIEESRAMDIASRSEGNIREAISLLNNSDLDAEFQGIFVDWIRASFQANTGKLVKWAEEMNKMGKQFQLNFLKYSARVFRQALLENYEAKDLSFLKLEAGGFKFESFISFVHGQNIHIILKELDEGIFHLERNGNAKIVLLDLSLKIARSLHMKYS